MSYSKQLSIGLNSLFLSFVLVALEVLFRYLLDTIAIGNSQLFAIWNLFDYEVTMVLYVSIVEFFKKGWVYLLVLLIFEGLIVPKLDDRTLQLISTVLLFLSFMIWDFSTMGFSQEVFYDASFVYLLLGFSFYLIRFRVFGGHRLYKSEK